MGYHTDFFGEFKLDRPLAPEHAAYLRAFNRTRRVKRNEKLCAKLPDPTRLAAGITLVGTEGAYYVGSSGLSESKSPDVLDWSRPPREQPNVYCQWTPNEAGTAIVWDEGEKFYDYVLWLDYILRHFLKGWGYVVNGTVEWQAGRGDVGKIVVKDSEVVKPDVRLYRKQHAAIHGARP